MAFGTSLLQDSNMEFPLRSKAPSPLGTPPLACAYSFFVLISKSVRTLMYYTWGNLTRYAVLRFQEDVVIFDASNLCFVSFPNRTKKKVRGWIFAWFPFKSTFIPCSADISGNIKKSFFCMLTEIIWMYKNKNN